MSHLETAVFIVSIIMSLIGIPLILIIIPADVQYLLGNPDSLMAIGRDGICLAAGVVSYICLIILVLGLYLDGWSE